ncbi:DgyrCDS13876 [Dimorphilus gyrociliatus]|uniref:DgyrCDS13876 n=1 Tax=Dimorphilus gyrociliatus TaxID=2664684 RepID=A0A7I8WBZ3_9ANNE|nr:DgyrCDS13876 [Dimorphilus gyrociliatus]
MKLTAEILASSAIKRKKPWSKLAFVGEKKESIVLLDKQRASILFLPSGKTKRKLPKLHSHLEKALCYGISSNGKFLTYLLVGGDILIWHKDTDLLRWITPPKESITFIKPKLYISNDARKLVLIDYDILFLIQASPQENVLNEEKTVLCCSWTKLKTGLTNLIDKNTIYNISCSFFFCKIRGECCSINWTYNSHDIVNIHTFFITWHQFSDKREQYDYKIHHFERNLDYFNLKLNRHRGAYITSCSKDARFLAIGANQKSTKATKLLFYCWENQIVHETDLLNCGIENNLVGQESSNFWICELEWNHDNIYVVGALKNGSLFVSSRFGRLINIETSGCSIIMGPKPFLALHPRIALKNEEDADISIVSSDPLRQKYSVACHPRLPIILFSDGYMATVLQFSSSLTNKNAPILMLDYLSPHLTQLQKNMNHSNSWQSATIKMPKMDEKCAYKFEIEPKNMTDEQAGGGYSFLLEQSGTAGAIRFPHLEELNSTKFFNEEGLSLREIVENIRNIWNFLFSLPGMCDGFDNCFSCLSDALMVCLKCLLSRKKSGKRKMLTIFKVYKQLFTFAQLDFLYQNFALNIRNFVNIFLSEILLKNLNNFNDIGSGIKNYISLLFFTDAQTNRIYERMPNYSLEEKSSSYKKSWWESLNEYFLQMNKESLSNEDVHQIKRILSKQIDSSSFQIPKSDENCLIGCSALAMDIWVQSLHSEDSSDEKRTKVLHSILYTLLIQDELRAAVELVELLIRQKDLKLAATLCQSDELNLEALSIVLKQNEQTTPIVYIENEAVLKVCSSLARFMAAYFTNSELYLYPAQNPKPISSLLAKGKSSDRTLPMFHSVISSIIRSEELSNLWTPHKVIDYMLLCGMIPEAVWFASKMGDWKTSFSLGFALEERKKILEICYDKPILILPEYLTPESILRTHVTPLLNRSKTENIYDKNVESASQSLALTLSDHLLAATLCQVESVAWVLKSLCQEIENTLAELDLMVVEDFYLPAPPLFSLQRFEENDEPEYTCYNTSSSTYKTEADLRGKLSNMIHLLKLMFSSSKTFKHCSVWYYQKIFNNIKKFPNVKYPIKAETNILPAGEQRYLQFDHLLNKKLKDEEIKAVVQSFEKMCQYCWLLHCRDMMNLLLRKKLKLFNEMTNVSTDNKEYSSQKFAWNSLILDCLCWSVHLAHFSSLLNNGSQTEVLNVILSLIQELPTSKNSADLLIHFNNLFVNADAEIDDRMKEILLKNWQTFSLNSSLTLSVYYYEQLSRSTKRPKNQFEFEPEYLTFLETLYEVGFEKYVKEDEQNEIPLLLFYGKQLEESELQSTSHKVATSLYKRQNFCDSAPSSAREASDSSKSSKRRSSLKITQAGLFKCRSLNDLVAKECAEMEFSSILTHGNLYSTYGNRVSPLDTPRSDKREMESESSSDVLTQNILSYAQLERFEFGDKFSDLETKLDWLMRWTGRSHVTCEENRFSVRLKVHPRMILYALWLLERGGSQENEIEHKVKEDPLMKTQGFIPSSDYRTVMAYPVHGERIPKSPRNNKPGKKSKTRRTSSASTDDDLTSVSALDTGRSNITDFLDSERDTSRNLTNDDVQNFMTKETSESDVNSTDSGMKAPQASAIKVAQGYSTGRLPVRKKSVNNDKVTRELSKFLMIEEDPDKVEVLESNSQSTTSMQSLDDDIPFGRRTQKMKVINELTNDSVSVPESYTRESETTSGEQLEDVESFREHKQETSKASNANSQFQFIPNQPSIGELKFPDQPNSFQIRPEPQNQQVYENSNAQPQFGNLHKSQHQGHFASNMSQHQGQFTSNMSQHQGQFTSNMPQQTANITEQMQYIVRNELASFIHAQQQSFMLMLNVMQPGANKSPIQKPVEQQTQTEIDRPLDDKPLRIEELNRSSNSKSQPKISIRSALSELNELKEINQNLALPLLSISKQSEAKKEEKPFQNLMSRLSEFNRSFGPRDPISFLRMPAEKESDALPKVWSSSMPRTDANATEIHPYKKFSMSGPLPLLRIEKTPTKTFTNIEDSRGFLRLIPMNEVAAFENHKRMAEDMRYNNLHEKGKKELWKNLQAEKQTENTAFRIEDVLQEERMLEDETKISKVNRQEKLVHKKRQTSPRQKMIPIIQIQHEDKQSEEIGRQYEYEDEDEDIEEEEDELDEEERETEQDLEMQHTGYSDSEFDEEGEATDSAEPSLALALPKKIDDYGEEELENATEKQVQTEYNLDHGYAITPGLFDRLVTDEELEKADLTYAEAQYRAAMELKKSKEISGKGIVAPEVFIDLEFREDKKKFINVVDIGVDVIEEINKDLPVVREQEVQVDNLNKTKKSVEYIEDSPKQHDKVTERVLGDSSENGIWSSENVEKLSRLKTKDQIKRRLSQMDERIQAINVMSKNMDHEFERNREVLKTLDRYTDEWEHLDKKQAVMEDDDEEIDRKFQELADEYDERSSKLQTLEEGEVHSIKDLAESVEVQEILKEVFHDEEPASARSAEPKVILSSRSDKSEKKRGELLEWMKVKKKEKDKMFREKRQELIQNEKHPFNRKQTATQPIHKEDEEIKKQRLNEAKYRRIMEADELMESLLREKIPRKKAETSVTQILQVTNKRKDIPSDKPSKQEGREREREKQQDEDPDRLSMDHYMKSIYEYDPVKQRAVKRVTSIGTLISDEKFHEKLREKRQELIVREKQEDIQRRKLEIERRRQERLRIAREAEEERQRLDHLQERQEEGEVIQSFEDFLKMQESERSIPNSERDTTRNTITFADEPRRYSAPVGSHHQVQKQSRITRREGPRIVKTYTQRLAELRVRSDKNSGRNKSAKVKVPNRTYSSLKPKEPRRKPVSYVEQLKQLQPQKGARISSKPRKLKSSIKCKKPLRQPITYQDQLQALQKNTKTVRQRPYDSPYIDDPDSDLSQWSVNSDMKRILYDGDTSAISKTTDSYQESARLKELVEAASLASDSTGSIIDWDRIQNILNDEQFS